MMMMMMMIMSYSMIGDLIVLGSWHREIAAFKLIMIYIADSELGQMFMTCGELSSQAPSVKSRLNQWRTQPKI